MKIRLHFLLLFGVISATVFGQKWSVNLGMVGSMPEEDIDLYKPLSKHIRASTKLGLHVGASFCWVNRGRNKFKTELNYLQTGTRNAERFNFSLERPVNTIILNNVKVSEQNIELVALWQKRLNRSKSQPFNLEIGFAHGFEFNSKITFSDNKIKNQGINAYYLAQIVGVSWTRTRDLSWFLRTTGSWKINSFFENFLNLPLIGSDSFFGFATLQTGIRYTLPPKKADD
jgi:hypothetical protein